MIENLEDLLCSLFDDYWLRAQLMEWYPQQLDGYLPTGVGKRILAREIIGLLAGSGKIDAHFYAHLLEERPGRAADIARIQTLPPPAPSGAAAPGSTVPAGTTVYNIHGGNVQIGSGNRMKIK